MSPFKVIESVDWYFHISLLDADWLHLIDFHLLFAWDLSGELLT
jgi:hypothetical protein